MILFSIPETYVLTDLMILIYLYCLIRFKSDLTLKKTILLSVIIGLGSLSNPPLLLLLVPNCYILYRLFNIKRFVLVSFVCTLISYQLSAISFGRVCGLSVFSFYSLARRLRNGGAINNQPLDVLRRKYPRGISTPV